MVTMELCRSARPLIAASHKWAQPGGWTYTMTPAAMWCEFMKMFYRQLSTCHILVHEFPADMSGYQGGALSKLLVQSLRPEWNKQEIASVGVDLQELHECILATGVVTPDEEQHNESSTALQKPSLQRRRSAFSFMFCCTRERDRSPPPPPPPAEEAVVAEAVAEAAAVNGLDLDSGGQGRANANLPDRHEQDPDQDQPAGTGTGSDEASKAYDPCTPWDSM